MGDKGDAQRARGGVTSLDERDVVEVVAHDGQCGVLRVKKERLAADLQASFDRSSKE